MKKWGSCRTPHDYRPGSTCKFPLHGIGRVGGPAIVCLRCTGHVWSEVTSGLGVGPLQTHAVTKRRTCCRVIPGSSLVLQTRESAYELGNTDFESSPGLKSFHRKLLTDEIKRGIFQYAFSTSVSCHPKF